MKEQLKQKLPTLSPEQTVRLEVFMSLFMEMIFEQVMVVSKFINEDEEKVPTWKYADFVVYCMQQEINVKFKGMKREFEIILGDRDE